VLVCKEGGGCCGCAYNTGTATGVEDSSGTYTWSGTAQEERQAFAGLLINRSERQITEYISWKSIGLGNGVGAGRGGAGGGEGDNLLSWAEQNVF